MKRFSLPVFGAIAMLGLAMLNPVLKADEYNRKTVISISQPLEVPGVVLPPGTYVMKLFNSSSDRHIVQIMNERQNQQLALTFAAAAERIRPTGKTVLTMYEGSQGAPPALRTWFYPGDTVGQEFLYPHKQAVSISERTKHAVPEVDTSQSTTAVISSETAQTGDESNATPGEPVLVARAEPAPSPVAAPEPEPIGAPEPIAAPEPQQPAAEPAAPPTTTQAPTAASDSLPKTAGYGPLAALSGGLSLALAFGIRKMRRSGVL
jgi:hypothetical protein